MPVRVVLYPATLPTSYDFEKPVEGCAGEIMDNLLAEKKAVPELVVMANGNLKREIEGGSYSREGIEVMGRELPDDVIPSGISCKCSSSKNPK